MKLKQLGHTDLGECCIHTKSKGLLYGDPLTKVLPTHYSEVGDFKIKIHWRTNDEAVLRKLHEVVLKVVEQPGSAESFLEISTVLRIGRRALDKDRLEKLVKTKSAQVFTGSESLDREEVELVASNLKNIS